ncbi:MAG: CsbD family protein [Mycobacteriales bacterium]
MSGPDKLKNKAQEVTGQGKEHLGRASGDEQLEAEGNKDQAAGNLKQAGEKVKDVFR